jgi:3-oxoacyl-[acyl-carrier-protein] synthase II
MKNDLPTQQADSADPKPQRSSSKAAPRGLRTTAVTLHEVVVTGIGVILPNCSSREELWRQLREGESQLSLERDPVEDTAFVVGRVKDFDCARYLTNVPERLYGGCHREQQFYLASIALAAQDAGLGREALASDRMGLFDGTSRSSFAFWYDEIRSKEKNPAARYSFRELHRGMPGQAVGLAAAMFGITGPTYTFTGSCASGGIAIGNAFRELEAGRIDVALATGHDVALIAPLFQMYRESKLMTQATEHPARAIQPYTGASGNAFGEGAVTLVLETRRHAEERGAPMLAQIVGYRHGNGGEHPTDVDFTGRRPARLIADVLSEAELDSADVGFVVGHGNGVKQSDISELNYMKRVFGARTREVPLISTKPIYGHTLGASSALNLAAATLMLQQDYVIPTINVDERAVVQGFHHQANRGVAKELGAGLVVTYGIGGQNAALALRKVTT